MSDLFDEELKSIGILEQDSMKRAELRRLRVRNGHGLDIKIALE